MPSECKPLNAFWAKVHCVQCVPWEWKTLIKTGIMKKQPVIQMKKKSSSEESERASSWDNAV